MMIYDGYLAPIFSMLSEVHNANFICFWLKEYIRLGGSVPDEFVVDMSMALLNAAVAAFTSHLNLKSYINALFVLNFDITKPVPELFIRIDIAHLLKAVAGCKHFANKKPKVRETYLRCVGLLLNATDINEARKIIFSVLVMAYSETEGMCEFDLSTYNKISISIDILFILNLGSSQSTGLNVPCEEAKQNINCRIQGTSDTHVENCLEGNRDEEFDNDRFGFDGMIFDSYESNEMNILTWINDIVQEAEIVVQEADDGNRDNLMENRPFAKYFINLCHMLPIWSAVSNKFFNSPNLIGSSWCSETGFKNTKQLHADHIPCSVDEFVKRDLELNNSTVIEASKKYLIMKNAPNPKESSTRSKSKEPSTRSVSKEKSSTRSKSKEKSTEKSVVSESTQNKPNVGSKEMITNESIENCDSQIDSAPNETDENDDLKIACPACADGNLPSGAHKCVSCNKPVHILDGCSISIGAEEGYGEKRKCVECFGSEQFGSLNSQEKWSKKTSKKSSKYTKPVANWGLVPVNKKVAISILTNENRSKNYYIIDNKRIKITNTCAIDAVIQVIAAAYAYHPAYRLEMANEDGIFNIARMMATGYVFNIFNNKTKNE